MIMNKQAEAAAFCAEKEKLFSPHFLFKEYV